MDVRDRVGVLDHPGRFAGAIVVFALLAGFCEARLGTRRTTAVVLVGQLGGVLGATLLVWLLAQTPWQWARVLAETGEVGFTTGALAALAVTTATLRSPWRLRVRAALWLHVTVAFLFERTLSDVAHAVAVGIGLLVGQWRWGVEPGFGPRTRRETRLLAFAGQAAIVATEVVVLFFPGSGPFGSTTATATSIGDVVLDLLIVAVIANALRHGKRWSWWATVARGSLNVLHAALVLVLIGADRLPEGAPVALGGALLWVGELVLLFANRGAFRTRWHRRVPGGVAGDTDSRAHARTLLTAVGGSTMSWMTTWPENRYLFTTDGSGYIAYQRHAGVALALADPVVPGGSVADAVGEFSRLAEQGGLLPCLFSVTDAGAEAARAQGRQTVQIAEDTILDLPDPAFKGKKWQDVRTALNHATRDGITFRLVHLADEPPEVLAQVRAISEQWVGDKGLPEMGFTLGSIDEALDPDVLVGLAVDATGGVHGVTSWLPVHAGGGRVRGHTLDIMRRRDDGFRPVMEFTIASACLELRERGAEFVSLSGAPLAHSQPLDLDGMGRALDKLGGVIEPLYGFRSLHTFKAKFSPRYESIHMAYRDEADLPRIGVALVRAYLPHTTSRQLLAATLHS